MQQGNTALMHAKAPAILPIIAYELSVQMQHSEKANSVLVFLGK